MSSCSWMKSCRKWKPACCKVNHVFWYDISYFTKIYAFDKVNEKCKTQCEDSREIYYHETEKGKYSHQIKSRKVGGNGTKRMFTIFIPRLHQFCCVATILWKKTPGNISLIQGVPATSTILTSLLYMSERWCCYHYIIIDIWKVRIKNIFSLFSKAISVKDVGKRFHELFSEFMETVMANTFEAPASGKHSTLSPAGRLGHWGTNAPPPPAKI